MTTIREIREYVEQTRRELHELIDQQIDAVMLQLDYTGTMQKPETELPLSFNAAYFKGKKPISLVYPDGTEVPASTWKKAAVYLLRHCVEDEQMRGRLEGIRGKVFGKNRLLFGDSGYGMDVPLEVYPGMFLESKFDTETLMNVITKRIFDPIGYDYSSIRLKITDPAFRISEKAEEMQEELPEEEIPEERLREEENTEEVLKEDFFPTM